MTQRTGVTGNIIRTLYRPYDDGLPETYTIQTKKEIYKSPE